MAEKLTESTAAKVGIVIIAVAAVGTAVFAGIRSNSGGDNAPANEKEVKADALKAIDTAKNNPNLPPALRAEIIAHNQGLMNGASKGAGGPAPSGTPGG